MKPLLESKLEEIKIILSSLIPEKKKRNVLEEAMYEDEGPGGFEGEVMMQGTQVSEVMSNLSFRICSDVPPSVTDLWGRWHGPTIPRRSNFTPP